MQPSSTNRRDALPAKTGKAVLLFGTLAVLYFARDILVPLAFALTVAFLLTPAVSLLERARIRRVPAVILTVLIALGVIGWSGWLIANQLVDVANQLPKYRENIHRKIVALRLPSDGAFGRATESLKEVGQELSAGGLRSGASDTQPVPVVVTQPDRTRLADLKDFTQPILRPLAVTFIVVIFTIFILIEKEDLRNRILRLAGLSHLNLMTQAIDDGANRVSRYLLMQFLVNAVFGAIIGLGLYFIGVPDAGLWGVVAAILRLVPYAGIMAAGILPIALSLAVFDSWMPPLLVFLLFAALELTTGNFVEPWLYGAHTGVSSLALLVTTVFWTALWGPAGLVLSTPLTVCLVVAGRYAPQVAFLHILLGDEAVLGSEALLYQRLLAMDQHEARAVVDEFMKSRPLNDLYDAVLIPALTLAENDRHRDAIDSVREEFFYLNINEMVAEFSEQPAGPPVKTTWERILCVPAHDQADEITAAMLAQLLEKMGCVALSFPVGPVTDEMLAALEPGAGDLICISALPPFAFNPARTACRRIRARFPRARIIVGVWGFSGDLDKAAARFDRTPPDRLFTTFAEVVDYVSGAESDPSALSTETAPFALPG